MTHKKPQPWRSNSVKEAVLIGWREQHPGHRDPDDDALAAWLIKQEIATIKAEWRDAHPGQPLPDDYAEVRRWYIEQRNIWAVEFARERGESFH